MRHKNMDTTPELPPCIRNFTDPEKKCTNIYELLPNETKLYGTESLVDENGVLEPSWRYGYWKTAELFLLAQYGSIAELRKLRRDGGANLGIRPHPDPF